MSDTGGIDEKRKSESVNRMGTTGTYRNKKINLDLYLIPKPKQVREL